MKIRQGEFPLRVLIILVYIGGLLESWNIILIRIPEHYNTASLCTVWQEKPLYAFISCVLFAVLSAMLTTCIGRIRAADILRHVYVIAVTLFSGLWQYL